MNRIRVDKNTVVLFLTALVLISAGFILFLANSRLNRQNVYWINHTYRVSTTIGQLSSDLKDTERGERGYLLTGYPEFLQLYYYSTFRAYRSLYQVKKLTADNPDQKEHIARLERLVMQKFEITSGLLRLKIGKRVVSPEAIFGEKTVIDQINDMLAIMKNTEVSLFGNRSGSIESSQRNTAAIIASLSLLSICILIYAFARIRSDIMKREAIEASLVISRQQLEEKVEEIAKSNKALEQFAFIASHDMQEPLRKVQAFSDKLRMKYKDQIDEAGVQLLDKIQHASARMSRLIKDLLDYSRLTYASFTYTDNDLNAIVKNVLTDLDNKIQERDAKVEVGKLPAIQGVTSQLNHLFLNLIANAIKFTPENAKPEIRIYAEDVYVKKQDSRDVLFVNICVQDNGIGFEEEFAEKIFVMFQRLHGKTQYEGTGIGLTICKQIVEHHKGTIRARSKPGEGAVFIMSLPLKQQITV